MNDPWRFQTWAYQQVTGNPVRKAVLSMLAMMADKETGRCEAKQATLAAGCEVGERVVRGHLKALEESGLIARRPQFRRDRGRRGDEFLLLAPGVTEWPDGELVAINRHDMPGGSPGTHEPGGAERTSRGPRNVGAGQELPLGNDRSTNGTATQSDAQSVWEHYRATRPNGSRCKLGDAEKRVIQNALKVRDVEECRAAIDGLFRSEWHVQGGFIGIKYALLGGGRSPDPGTTIDRLAHLARHGGNGNSNGNGKLKGHAYGGLSWDELTPAAQAHIREAAAMGLEPWDGGADAADRELRAPAGSNGRAGVTAENILDPD